MSTYGIISDVHGNLEALRAALQALEVRGVDRVLCLGDIVGYNAESNQCVALFQSRGIETIAGNHDLIALGRLGVERCSDKPAFTLRRTRKDLSRESRRYLGDLPLRRIVEKDVALIHGGVLDVQQYITTERRVFENDGLLAQEEPHATLCFFGHTHEPKVYEIDRGTLREHAPEGTIALGGRRKRYFINPGSIDASRKSEHKFAEFIVFDADTRTVEFHAVPYDHESVERSAARAGYRMDRVDEWLYRGLRWVRRGRRYVARRLAGVAGGG
jgi:predicted phosphodiesterase